MQNQYNLKQKLKVICSDIATIAIAYTRVGVLN